MRKRMMRRGMKKDEFAVHLLLLRPPGALKDQLDNELDPGHDAELAELQAAFDAKGGPSHLDAMRFRLEAEGHSDAWITVMLDAEVNSLASQLEAGDPGKTRAFPGWGKAAALQRLQSPTR